MSWNDERVDTLKRLHALGLSCSLIASRLGGISRSAVIGKLHRLGLANGNTPLQRLSRRAQRPRRLPRTTAAQSATIHAQRAAQAQADYEVLRSQPEIVIPLHERKTILTLESGDCRWPMGDPQHADFHFCGRRKVEGLPYCATHCARAFQAPALLSRKSAQGAVATAKPAMETV